MPSDSSGSPNDWNSSERRAGIDQWPEAEATVTGIEQPFVGAKFGFLSVVSYTFKDASGEYFAGKYQTPTSELADDVTEGATIKIRYNPKNPNKSWCAHDYLRAGFGRFQSFDYPIALLCLLVFSLAFIAIIEIFHLRVR
jgi:hypothetical protein